MRYPTKSATAPVAKPYRGPTIIPDNIIGIVPREIRIVPRLNPKKRVKTTARAAKRLAEIRFLVFIKY